MKNLRCYYSDTVTNFLRQSTKEILGIIHSNDVSAETTIQQSNTWEIEVDILKSQLADFEEGRIIFEYTIPRMGKRVDVVLLYKNIVFLLEFKCGDKEYKQSTYDQVYDYALDLRNFQKASHDKLLVPIMISTKAPVKNCVINDVNHIIEPISCNAENIGDYIKKVANQFNENEFDYINWENSEYLPTPTNLAKDLKIDEQSVVDTAKTNLETAKSGLELRAEKYSDLETAITEAENKLNNANNHTQESKDELSAVISSAKNLVAQDLKDTTENNATIEAKIQEIENAIAKLDENEYANYEALNNAIAVTDEKYDETKEYTSSKTDFLDALEKAKELANGEKLLVGSQETITKAAEELENATTNLKEKADYSAYKTALQSAKEKLNNQNYTDESKAILSGAIVDAEKLNLDLADTEANRKTIVDEAVATLNEAMKMLYDQRKADYSKLDSVILAAKDVLNDGKVYTSKSETNLKNALKNAEAVDRGLFVDNQSIIDEATDILNKAIADIVERADYTEIEDEVIESEEVLSEENPEDDIIYTTSSKNALQEALLAFENLDEDLPVDKQYIVTEIETDIEAARIGIKIKADYTKLDKAVAEAEKLLSLDVEYVDLYRIMLENTLILAENIHRDLSTDDQSTIDNVTGYINYAMDKLNQRADYSEYDAALSEIKDIIRKGYDGSCDYKDWDEFVATVTDVAVNLPQNLPVEEQARVDKALEKITDARAIYESKKYIVNEEQQGEVMLPTDPENPESVSESTELIITSQSTARKEDGLLIGLPQGTAVAELLTQFNNDSAFLLVKDMNSECITAESLIATGMTIELVSKDDIQVILEKVTVVVKGDVTGDGLVNREDYKKSFNVCFGNDSYTDSERAFFEANDTNGNGRIDINDVFNISNLRLFVSRLYALCISD